jgi:MinD superfamily P-loop ATPase
MVVPPRERLVVAVASGKGGTGKTTVAVNLAVTAARAGRKVTLVDCDVEAPNAHLFLRLESARGVPAYVAVPVVDESKCTACGECGRVCRFSAIVSLKTKPLLFPELCHGCGGCALVCPSGAITEGKREIGRIDEGRADGVAYAGGVLRIGEAMSPPLIRQVKAHAPLEGLVIRDAPPGAACPAVEAMRGADLVLLVTEPTPFGLNDLGIAVETVRGLALPFGVVVNRASPDRPEARQWCTERGIDVLAEFPDDRRVAEAYSRGCLIIDAVEGVRPLFDALLGEVERRVSW